MFRNCSLIIKTFAKVAISVASEAQPIFIFIILFVTQVTLFNKQLKVFIHIVG